MDRDYITKEEDINLYGTKGTEIGICIIMILAFFAFGIIVGHLMAHLGFY